VSRHAIVIDQKTDLRKDMACAALETKSSQDATFRQRMKESGDHSIVASDTKGIMLRQIVGNSLDHLLDTARAHASRDELPKALYRDGAV
jgi:hypothetical protein